jgi:hypothetical protein
MSIIKYTKRQQWLIENVEKSYADPYDVQSNEKIIKASNQESTSNVVSLLMKIFLISKLSILTAKNKYDKFCTRWKKFKSYKWKEILMSDLKNSYLDLIKFFEAGFIVVKNMVIGVLYLFLILIFPLLYIIVKVFKYFIFYPVCFYKWVFNLWQYPDRADLRIKISNMRLYGGDGEPGNYPLEEWEK